VYCHKRVVLRFAPLLLLLALGLDRYVFRADRQKLSNCSFAEPDTELYLGLSRLTTPILYSAFLRRILGLVRRRDLAILD